MPENLFEKIDKQSETLDQVAEKLDGISIEDLYALAKRTWDYGDYPMAQKYYNHISLLAPLDWEAPFRASLCGCLGVEKVVLWGRRPRTVCGYFESTVEYIESCSLAETEKNHAVAQATDIILAVFNEYIRIYLIPENRKSFDEYAPEFKRELQKALIRVIKKSEECQPDSPDNKHEEACRVLGDFLADHCQADKSIVITKNDFDQYIRPFHPEIQYDVNMYEEPNPEKEKEIKLKGRCYLEYKDKVIAVRQKKKNLFFAILLFAATLVTTIVPIVRANDGWFSLAAVIFVPMAIVFFLRSISCVKGVRQDGWIYPSRWKYRESSDGSVVCERKSAGLRIALYIVCWLSISILIGTVVVLWDARISWIDFALMTGASLVQVVSTWVFASADISEYDCFRRFEYQGKVYRFNK